jgi:hypothetical protein
MGGTTSQVNHGIDLKIIQSVVLNFELMIVQAS